jgi:uncharacterized protein
MSAQEETGIVTRRGPEWPEIVVGLVVFLVVAYGTPSLLTPLDQSPVVRGLALAALSGVAGIIAFVAATAIRVRTLEPFGIRPTTVRWILFGIGGGVLAFLLTRIVGLVTYAMGIQPENVQATYTEGGSGGVWSVVLSLVFLAVLTPLGEELLFRGVITSALLRYGALVGVVGSAVIFALVHGFNAVLITALIVGLINGELRRRSGSVWPGVATHIVNNALAQAAALLLAGLA